MNTKPTDFELEVCNAIINYDSLGKELYETYGDKFYPFARRQTPFFKEAKIGTFDVSKLKKKEKIIYENSIRIIEDALHPRKNVFNMNVFTVPSIATSKTLELRGLCFIYFAHFIAKHHEKYAEDMPFVFGVIVSFQRFIMTIVEEHKETFSELALKDMQKFCKNLCKSFDFNGNTLHKIAPSLISSSPFDKYVPREAVRPYQHQIDAPKLLESLESGFVDIYNTSTNSGKTFTTVGIAHRVRELKPFFCELQFIFCCEIQSVRQKVAQLLHHSGIRTGIYQKTSSGEYTVKGDFSYKRVAVVCDAEYAFQLLSTPNAREKYVLFIDEITMGASDIGSSILKNYMRVFSVSPKWVYVSNANLPCDGRIGFLTEFHHKTFPNSRFEMTSSNVIFSCSTVETYSKQAILPHMSCKTIIQLKTKLCSIYENQFKGKMYNPSAIRIMYDQIIHFIKWSLSDDGENITPEEEREIMLWKQKLPDIDMLFGDVSQLYSDNIRKIAMNMLEVVVEFDDDYMVEMFCKIPKGVERNSVDVLTNLPLHEYQNVTLVAHPRPAEFAPVMFQTILTNIKEKIGSLHKMQQTYEKTKDEWQKQYEKLSSKYKDEKDLAIAQGEMIETRPKFPFPEEYQINTLAFLKRLNVSRKTARVPMQLETINTESMKNEDLILLLYAGVGVYSETTDSAYRETVLDLISQGKLEFIISDVCYGMDYPMGCLFITSEFSDRNDLNAIYQLMSRVGRGRMSYMGCIFIDEKCVSRILDSGDETSSLELNNMEKMLYSM